MDPHRFQETYSRIVKVDIQWPAIVSPGISHSSFSTLCAITVAWNLAGARDLIGKLLRKRPADRLSLDKVMEHPWIVEHTSKVMGPEHN